ncbi:bi-domain-containing oxidoreductase [Anaerosinus sp.]|uniref:bi-domain-containing oxidoreductase n=1 Tax=Selenobaculum sp. TaxID=3074374 RepID=UPI003AB1FB20
MKQVLIKKGQAIVEEIPTPQVEKNKILVKVSHSCISIGTEMSGVRTSATPLWKRAIHEPQNVKKVFSMITTSGLEKTKQIVKGKLESGNPVGYSAAGIVLGVGDNIKGIKIGDRVACAGAQCAHHAEIINVPRNLLVKIPDSVSFQEASTVTLGSIAMQGVRRAETTLGECFVVIGLGVIGQITVQLLKASGCKVIVTDLDKNRIEMALRNGADVGIHPDDGLDIDVVNRITNGIGADGVIITAATKSNAVVSTAFKMCRRKGRVVLVGDVGLHLNRSDFYEKEIDFFISTSYGPGRYDSKYEEKGLEYPVAYVRWTENRNMQEVLELIAKRKLNVIDMVESIYSIDKATEAYETLKISDKKPLMVLLEYPENENKIKDIVCINKHEFNKARVTIAVIGAGGFAKGMHLPNINKLKNLYQLEAVMSRTGHNAMAVAKQFGANYATTNYNKILEDKNIDAVLIATRHNLHAGMVIQALKAGKHVLVEKPLAINETELQEIERYYEEGENTSILLTGFNRRHSKSLQEIYKHTSKRTNPMIINYKMNAGHIHLDHWVHTEEGGGRNIGEACHIYDVFNFLTDAKVTEVSATSIQPQNEFYSSKDNFVATIRYEDGSVANLIYTAMGNSNYPKETMEIFFDGKMIFLDDYKKINGYGMKLANIESKISEKGQLEEIKVFAKAIKDGTDFPIPLWQQVQAMRIAFEVEKGI